MMNVLCQALLFSAAVVAVIQGNSLRSHSKHPPSDCEIPPRPSTYLPLPKQSFKYKWLAADGSIYDDEISPGNMLEMAATELINDTYFAAGAEVMSDMMKHSPEEVFYALAARGSVGFFTWEDKTTIFPEYEHLRDRPECEGSCAGSCSDTCTGDGRKYDSLAGLGGQRATCVDSNFMCLDDDPYGNVYSVLVHEFAHTIHQYALPYSSDYWQLIYDAWINAHNEHIWDQNSYAMSNHLEYFAEASGVFFNVNFHPSSSGGMNGCGHPVGFCGSEEESRAWLKNMDPLLFDALSFTYTDYYPNTPGEMEVCPM